MRIRASKSSNSRHAKERVMVVIDPEVAKIFPTARSVNKALRILAGIIKRMPKSGAH